MITYSATLAIDSPTRAFLQNNGYTLYLFKGINAGKGATSTVWLTITGNQLWDQSSNTVTWFEDYYIGEESTEIQNGAKIHGTNPYISPSNIHSVNLGQTYTFPGTAWNAQATSYPTDTVFAIKNAEGTVNNFYVSQKTASGPEEYIVVKSLLGSGGLGTFEPIETIAMIFSTEAYATGTMITQAFSPGAIISLAGGSSASVAYDMAKGWSATAGQLAPLDLGDAVYDSMLTAAANSVAAQTALAQARWRRLGGGKVSDIVESVKFNPSPLSAEDGPTRLSGTITVKVAVAAGLFTVFTVALLSGVFFKVVRVWPDGTTIDFTYDGTKTAEQIMAFLVKGAQIWLSASSEV